MSIELRNIRQKRKISAEELGKAIGVSKATISLIESGKVKLDNLKSQRIAKVLNCKISDIFGETEFNPEITSNNMISIKYFPDVLASAGVGCLVNNENFDIINIDEKQLQEMGIKSNYENIAVIKVKGFSMQPTLQDGDLLFVDLSKKEIFNNRIYIINENNLLKVKRLIRESPFSNKATVKSDNQIDGEYPPYEVDLQNINDNFICGQVIFYCRSIE